MPSQYTIEAQQEQRRVLPFADKQDFEEAKRGFIAAPPFRKIMNDKGEVAWNIDKWDFLLNGKDYDSIHPSLQRQALLNMEYGLFEVVPGIYQVRGFDLANISFIKGNTGWIVIDPLDGQRDRACRTQVRERETRRTTGGGGDHFALSCRPFRRYPRRRGRRCPGRWQGADYCSLGIHERSHRREPLRRQCYDPSQDLYLRRSCSDEPLRSGRCSDWQVGCQRRCRHTAPNQEHRPADRGTDHRRDTDGLPEHSGHRGALRR